MGNALTRRSFVKWGSAAVGATALAGFVSTDPVETSVAFADEALATDPAEWPGEWKTGACMNNCSCGSSRCLLRVYCEDGVPLKIKTDELDEDTIEIPQRRACPRGRAYISNVTSPARIKYPMKRKNWSPEEPNRELRGVDEWERISWDEALDYIAAELTKAIDTYGTKSVLCAAYSDIGDTYFDPVICLMNELGGAVHHEMGTVSLGSWPLPEMFMTGGMLAAPDALSMAESDLHILFGCNWMANKGGNTTYQLDYARKQGGKIIIIEPWLNQTAQAVADEWIPIIPGTDTVFCLGMAYHQIENGLFDQEYLDKYCIGFDADHMPETANAEDNFKDYVLGTYDGEPKTPEWAEAICGVPAEKIRELAEEIAAAEKVNFFAGQSTSKIPAGEMFCQVFYTLAFMHGGMGSNGNYASWVGLREGMSTAPYVMAGDSSNGFGLNPVNPLKPASLSALPNWAEIGDADWENVDYSECWVSVLNGEYGRDIWPGGKRPLDIHVIYTGGYENSLNSVPNANAGIQAFRKVDFVFGADPFFTPSQQYADIVLPVATWWEKGNLAWMNNSETVFWADRVLEPLYESKPEGYIAEGLATRMGVDPKKVNTMTDEERTYVSLAGAMYLTDSNAMDYKPLLTITQEDIDEMGMSEIGQPQEGLMTIAEFKEKGCYKTQRAIGDKISYIPWQAFYDDPEANPLPTASGKFEIYCETLAAVVNSCGFSNLSPIGKWQANPDQGAGAQTDEFPLLLWTPHSLRRAHTVNDSVTSLREAFPQECFMSTVDAEARGIANGDLVLMTSPHGQVLRPAKVMPTIVPGAVALQDGAWIQIDPETGIDLGGDPNILQAPASSGGGAQAWTGTIVQVEKYTGDIELLPDKHRPIVMPVGIED